MLVIALDDERMALENLTDAIKKALPEAELHSFRSTKELLAFASENKCDIAFLDIKLRSVSGLAVGEYLIKRNPKVNLIFTTGFSEFAPKAFDLHASGYILKPITPEKITEEMEHLRYPLQKDALPRVRIRAFGRFEVYIDGIPASFRYAKTREFLAILVDQKGAMCSNDTLTACLWEDDDPGAHKSYLKNLRSDLINSLAACGCENILARGKGTIGILPDRVVCDYFNYLQGKSRKGSIDDYRGEYMSQYSWAEYTHALLENDYMLQNLS
ncbi:MAG: response regulator [Lachnospiraceae bacterium]|nr:response regulator [Lachnospiraceae bacterium]